MRVRLTRYFRSEVQCRGILEVVEDREVIFECKTLELPWRQNERRKSCIPPGPDDPEAAVYTLRFREAVASRRFDYRHFLVKGVDGRSYILIHAGNLYTDILGCILVGYDWVDINDDGHPDVVNSRATLAELRSVVENDVDFVVRWIDQMARTADIEPMKPELEPDVSSLPDLSNLA